MTSSDLQHPQWLVLWRRYAAVVGGVILIIPIAYVGTFTRYLADDFCTLGSLRELGFWGSQVYWYVNWSGRFAFMFTVNVIEAIGAWLVPVLPSLHLAGLIVGTGWAFERWLAPRAAARVRWTGWLIGGLVVYETIGGAPNIYQSLYWQTGGLTYVLPLVLAVFYAAWILSRVGEDKNTGPGSWLVAGLWMAVAVGFSETVGSLIVSALAGSFLLLWILGRGGHRRTRLLRLLCAGFIGGVVGMVIMAAAPGNASRQALLTPSSSVIVWLTETARNAYIFSVKTLRADPLRLALGLGLPLLLTATGGRDARLPSGQASSFVRGLLFLFLLPLFTFGLVMACMAPTQYAMASYPDGRILISAQFAVAVGMAVWGAAAGRWLVHHWSVAEARVPQISLGTLGVLVVILLAFTSLQTTRALLAPLPDARDFAARSDERLAKVIEARQDGVMSLPVASLNHMGGLDEISRDPTHWVNVCFSQAYGLKRVEAK